MIKTSCSLPYLLSKLKSVMTALKDRTLQGFGMFRVAREPKRVWEIKKKAGVKVLFCVTQKCGPAFLCFPTNDIKIFKCVWL